MASTTTRRALRHIIERVDPAHTWRQRWRRQRRPARLGTLRRTAPLSCEWGYDRGTPIDRYYIEGFLARHSTDIRGRVLEVRHNTYTRRFGQAVACSDVLDIDPSNQAATIVVDLTSADAVSDDQFDCFILTQTLQFIYDTRAAIHHAHRILRPSGVLLVTIPSISRVAPRYGLESDYWRFTVASCRILFGDVFGAEQISVHSHGNALTSIAFLAGMAREELRQSELDAQDDHFPVVITVRAVKSAQTSTEYAS